jgi:ABC-type lipoprotein export system ATPase subunit/GNAT superfamily N-acetyltransferase
MQSLNIIRQIDITRTPRVMQLEGLFDISASKKSSEKWNVSFELPENWNIGVIVGPSGSGKTTIINELFSDSITGTFEWSDNKSIVDCFPEDMSIKDICEILSSVGFSSPPSWLRPFRVLSNGEQFRVTLARALSEKNMIVFDEFTSVVDRTVAQIGSAAVSKTVRKRNQRFIAATCHYDILEWLEPDWIYDTGTNKFHNGRYLQRPKISISIHKVSREWWTMFRKHHYLDTHIHQGSQCFLATWNNRPVAFVATLHFPHPTVKRFKREHRLVCLPDFQGVGIGNALSNWIGDYWQKAGYRYLSVTSHPAMIAYRNKSGLWRMKRKLSIFSGGKKHIWRKGNNRLTASFEYIGPSTGDL